MSATEGPAAGPSLDFLPLGDMTALSLRAVVAQLSVANQVPQGTLTRLRGMGLVELIGCPPTWQATPLGRVVDEVTERHRLLTSRRALGYGAVSGSRMRYGVNGRCGGCGWTGHSNEPRARGGHRRVLLAHAEHVASHVREALTAIVGEGEPEAGSEGGAVVPRYVIEGGWLVEDTGEHDCAGGGSEASGAHEAHCGLVPVMPVERLARLLAVGPPEPVRWWRVVLNTDQAAGSAGDVWAETSDEAQARRELRRCPGGGTLQQLYERPVDREWRTVYDDEPTSGRRATRGPVSPP